VPRKASWTTLIFAPSNLFEGLDIRANLVAPHDGRSSIGSKDKCRLSVKIWRPQQGNDFGNAMLAILAKAAEVLVGNWQRLSTEILRECDAGTITIMDPEGYVHLLYDDARFRRSRFYFWAIGYLSLFEKSIAGNLSHFEKIRSKIVEYDRKRGGDLEDDKAIGEFDASCRNLYDLHQQLQKKLDDMRSLRDGVRTFPDLRYYLKCHS
jgi:hypothetical protein